MQLLLEQETQQAYRSLHDDRIASLPDFIAGGIVPISLVLLDRVRNAFDSRVFIPSVWTDWTDIRVSLGGSFEVPVAGTWTISFEDETSDLLVPADPAAIDIQAALDMIDAIEDAGGIEVAGENGFFVLTFNENGVRDLIEGDAAELVPVSILDFQTAVIGDVDTRAVQTLRIRQNVGALVTLDTDSDVAEAELDTVQVGDATHNHKIRITLPPDRWGGAWTLTQATEESEPIGWDDNEAQVQAALEAMDNIGPGNVSVQRESEDSYLVTFIGDLASMEVEDLSVDGSTLRQISTKSGSLDLRTIAMDFILNGSDSKVVRFEVEGIEPGGTIPVKLLQRDVMLRRSVASGQSTVPPVIEPANYYTKEEIDALLAAQSGSGSGQGDDLVVNAAGTTNLAATTAFAQWFQLVTAQAGAGVYTHKLTLDDLHAGEGSIYRIEIDLPDNTNPTIEIYDQDVGGTLLQTLQGAGDEATYFVFEGRFNGTNWLKLSGAYQ